MNKKPLIVIVGPTAVGKSDIAIELALKLNGEIVSADSMQIYKHMDIGTAKVTKEQQESVKHYLIDEINPDCDFNVALYKERADKYIENIIAKGKIPIIVGGTGLYINSIIDNIKFSQTISDEDYREKLKDIADSEGNEYLHNMLKQIDPITAEKLHFNDTRRVIRAMEVYEFTGIPISEHEQNSKKQPSPYAITIIGLTMERELLYKKIELRVDIMIEQGLIEEVKNLLSMGYNRNMVSMQGLGYKEMIDYIEGNTTLCQAIEILKRDTRRYSKRQLTWFRRNKKIYWIEAKPENKDNKKEILEKCLKHIAGTGIM